MQAEVLQLPVEGGATDTEPARHLGHLPPVVRQREADQLALHVVKPPHVAVLIEQPGQVRIANVHGPGSEPRPRAADPVRPGNSDLCFLWEGPIEGAVEHLGHELVEVELGPVERTGARGTGTSVYFRDPDGSLLELISYG